MLPLRPIPPAGLEGAKAIATFGASAMLGLGGFLVAMVPHLMPARGATRSARLVKVEARSALDEAAAEEKAREP
jgi:hypothetical protein